ncbi:response regulator [Ruegeria sp. ANG10]|uniref:response regulator n=1 Tax=Ruegeria sp. ANG10 TaxID=3042467 RepID=UPI0034546B92
MKWQLSGCLRISDSAAYPGPASRLPQGTRCLKREGYTNLVEACDGHEALGILAKASFDLVLPDFMMPGMNGFETLECMKSDMALRDIPVIIVSAVDEIESVMRCIKLGAADHLPKPFNSVLLRARISASLEKKCLRDQPTQCVQNVSKMSWFCFAMWSDLPNIATGMHRKKWCLICRIW